MAGPRATPATPERGSAGRAAPAPRGAAPLAPPAWLLAIALGCVLLGLAGFSGSSSWAQSVNDPLLEPEVRARRVELVGRSRPIRSDEYGVELPLERSQQLAAPSFPLVNVAQGLGQVQRNAYTVPVLDWGAAFRPLTWPLFAGTRWGLGVRWFMRSALLLLGAFGWMRALCGTPASPRARRRRAGILGACAVAVFYSSAVSWWMSHSLPEIVGFAGLALGAAARREAEVTRARRAAWLALTGWLAACAFFAFYPPVWGPTLWILCAALFDLRWRATRDVRRAALESAPYVLLVAAGVALSIAYFAPYLVAVSETLYPGRRVALAGGFPASRLLDLAWPSLLEVAAAARAEQYLGATPGTNVCEAASIEALPLLVLAALALDARVRAAARRAAAGMPMTLAALALLAAWVFAPSFPPLLGTALLLRWSPPHRVWFAFAFGVAMATAALLAELDGEDAGGGARGALAWGPGVAVAAVLGATWVAAQRLVAVPLVPPAAVHHAIPFVLFGALAVAAALAVRRGAAAPLLAAAWAIPLVAANFAVNPLVRSDDLAREGEGHRVVAEALRSTPGRVVHYATHGGTYPNAFGWPLLVGVEQSPDVHLFRFLAPETPGLTEDVFNRYAHVVATLPPEPASLMQADAFRLPIDPCSARVATLGVNHFLVHPEYAARVPEACAWAFSVRRAGDVVLWTRRAPVGQLGIARTPAPRSALEFDFAAGAARGARVTLRRDGLTVDLARDVERPVALAVNRSLIDHVRCDPGTSTALDAHLVVWPAPGLGARCRLDYLGTAGALRRLARAGERSSP